MLGSRKFLIFGIVSAVLLSLFVVCASAEDVVRQDDSFVFSRSLSAPSYVLTTGGVASFRDWLNSEGYDSSNKFVADVPLYYVARENYSSNSLIDGCFFSNGYIVVTYNGGDHNITAARSLGFDSTQFYNFLITEVGVSADDFISADAPSSVFGFALAFFSAILGVGSQLVTFVVARPIVLLPIVAMVLVLGIGVIRRLVKGA